MLIRTATCALFVASILGLGCRGKGYVDNTETRTFKLTGAAIVKIDPNGYYGPICVLQTGDCTPEAESRNFDLAAGTYTLANYHSWSLTADTTILGGFTIASDGTVTLTGEAPTYFNGPSATCDANDEQPCRRIQAKTVDIEFDANGDAPGTDGGYAGQVSLYGNASRYGSGTMRLLVSRRYRFWAIHSYNLDSTLSYYFSEGPDLLVGADGTVNPIGSSITKSFTIGGARIAANVSVVNFVADGYTSEVQVYGTASGFPNSAALLKNRRYRLYAYHSFDVGTDLPWFSDTPDLEVDESGTVAPVGNSVTQSLTISGTTIEAKMGTVVIGRGGYQGQLQIYGHLYQAPENDSLRAKVIIGRRYRVWPNGTSPDRVSILSDGTCAEQTLTYGSYSLPVSCTNTVPIAKWATNTSYTAGARVLHLGQVQTCVAAHTSSEINAPNVPGTLWAATSAELSCSGQHDGTPCWDQHASGTQNMKMYFAGTCRANQCVGPHLPAAGENFVRGAILSSESPRTYTFTSAPALGIIQTRFTELGRDIVMDVQFTHAREQYIELSVDLSGDKRQLIFYYRNDDTGATTYTVNNSAMAELFPGATDSQLQHLYGSILRIQREPGFETHLGALVGVDPELVPAVCTHSCGTSIGTKAGLTVLNTLTCSLIAGFLGAVVCDLSLPCRSGNLRRRLPKLVRKLSQRSGGVLSGQRY